MARPAGTTEGSGKSGTAIGSPMGRPRRAERWKLVPFVTIEGVELYDASSLRSVSEFMLDDLPS